MSSFALLLAATAMTPAPTVMDDTQQRAEEIVVTGTRTEGSDDYAIKAQSTATRLPLSLRETPQSVSVVTRAQIEDFQLNDINALLATVPGVNVQAQETDRFYYSARGFDIQTFQIDGVGLPFPFQIQNGSGRHRDVRPDRGCARCAGPVVVDRQSVGRHQLHTQAPDP